MVFFAGSNPACHFQALVAQTQLSIVFMMGMGKNGIDITDIIDETDED